MDTTDRIAKAISNTLDDEGVEFTWRVVYRAAKAVETELYDELEESWMYRDLCK